MGGAATPARIDRSLRIFVRRFKKQENLVVAAAPRMGRAISSSAAICQWPGISTCYRMPQGFQTYGRSSNLAMSSKSIRSEEHTSELQSLMRTSYAVFCLKKKNKIIQTAT